VIVATPFEVFTCCPTLATQSVTSSDLDPLPKGGDGVAGRSLEFTPKKLGGRIEDAGRDRSKSLVEVICAYAHVLSVLLRTVQ
jgi:hypothetical protein